MSQEIIYTATETASEFHYDNSFVRIMFGPVGCGKSVASCLEILIRAKQQAKGNDGIRRTRWAVIRNTYPELKSTTLTTWKTWYPESQYGNIKYDSPIFHHLKFDDVDCEVYFIALESMEDIKKLRSMELTGVYINELQYIHFKIFEVAIERVNRYPPKMLGAPLTWTGVIADTNPPDNDHWIYKRIDEEAPKGYKIFKYAPALLKVDKEPANMAYATSRNGTHYINNTAADYRSIQNDLNYWLMLVSSKTDEEVKSVLLGEYGLVVTGKPVHPSYNDMLHYSKVELEANKSIELGLGWDFGLTPACAIGQLSPRGQFQSIDELWSEDMDLRSFASDIVIPHLDKFYPWWRKNYISVHDPAGSTGAQTDGRNCEDILKELGIKSSSAAPNNDPTPRRDGLDYFLGKMVDGQPAYIVSIKCKRIRKGLMGSFQYARIKVGGDERFHEKPLKNMYSHICEALEYLAMRYAGVNKKPPPSKVQPFKIHRGSFLTL